MSDQLRAMAEPSLFPMDGEVSLPGLAAPVTVERDRWGTPRITATSLEDLWFAQGVVTAGERLFQLELFLRAATGRLSEIFGELTYDDDVFTRTIGLNRAGERHAAETWTELDHAMHGRFRAGVHAWIDAMPAKPRSSTSCSICSRPCRRTPAPYASAFALLAWNLSNNWEAELLRAELDDRLGRAVTDTLLPVAPAGGGVGSNNWVVAGRRTASGAPLLANDPHLLVTQPGIWLELVPARARLRGARRRGAVHPGDLPRRDAAPRVGRHERHGRRRRPVRRAARRRRHVGAHPRGVGAPHHPRGADRRPRRAGATGPARARDAARSDPDPRRRRGSAHALPSARSHLRAAVDRATTRRCGRRSRSRSPRRPTSPRSAPRCCRSRAPDRTSSTPTSTGTSATSARAVIRCGPQGDGTRPVPGWDGRHEWIGWIAPEDLPWEFDPDRGWLATANNDIQPPGYPHLIVEGLPRAEPARPHRGAARSARRRTTSPRCWRSSSTRSRSPCRRSANTCARSSRTPTRSATRWDRCARWDGDLRADSHAGGAVPGMDQRDHGSAVRGPDGPGAVRRVPGLPRDVPVPGAARHARRPGRPRRAPRRARRRDRGGRRPNVGRAAHARARRTRWRGSPGSTRSSPPRRSRSAATARRWPRAGSTRCSATARP